MLADSEELTRFGGLAFEMRGEVGGVETGRKPGLQIL